ncbi:ribonuclease G [Patescibacteria group bacterium]|nr:ribonuclease G [Patescibacteria group bacterium]
MDSDPIVPASEFTLPQPSPQAVSPAANTSGQGRMSVIPPEIKGWNWGAFGLNWIWGLGNSTYIALLTFVPVVGFVMVFILGVKGNEWAWQNHHWDSIEHFKKHQRTWTIVWLALIGAGILFWLAAVLLVVAVSPNR